MNFVFSLVLTFLFFSVNGMFFLISIIGLWRCRGGILKEIITTKNPLNIMLLQILVYNNWPLFLFWYETSLFFHKHVHILCIIKKLKKNQIRYLKLQPRSLHSRYWPTLATHTYVHVCCIVAAPTQQEVRMLLSVASRRNKTRRAVSRRNAANKLPISISLIHTYIHIHRCLFSLSICSLVCAVVYSW